jgi:hypothetical protein
MLKNIKFEANISADNMKLGLDLQIPKDLSFKFELAGECDREFLKKLVRIIKTHTKVKDELEASKSGK